jgi:hypothetical protein
MVEGKWLPTQMATCLRYLTYTLILSLAIIYRPPQFMVDAYKRYKLRNEHIVVSLTTTPYRIGKMAKYLQAIIEQNVKIDNIYLCVPHKFKRNNLEYNIPDFISQNKKITILRTEDYGPGTKLLGVLETVKLPPKTIIITLDDDTPYPKNLILELAYKAYQNPDKAVGLSGGDPAYDQDGFLDEKYPLGLHKRNMKENSMSVLLGYAGIAYRVEFLDEKVFDIVNSDPGCIYGDDFYMSFYLAQKNIERINVKNRFISAFSINWLNELSTSEDALNQLESTGKKYKNCLAFMQSKYPEVNF